MAGIMTIRRLDPSTFPSSKLGDDMSINSGFDEDRRRFYRSLSVARERWWVVAICSAICGVLALGYSLAQTPLYKSSATLYVTSGTIANSQNAYQGNLASQQRVDSYVRLVKSDAVLTDAMLSSGLDLSVDKARESVSASAAPDTVLLNVTAVRDDPVDAAALANSVAAAMTRYVFDLERPDKSESPLAKVTVVTPATASASAFSPNTLRNTLLGLIVGLIAGVLALLARARLDNRVRDADDVEMLVGNAPLSTVAVDDNLKSQIVVNFEAGGSALAESYRHLRTNISFASVDLPAKRILITSPGEGEGKTTTAINLAASLAETGASVVLVDADLRKPTVASRLGLSSSVGLTECLRDGLSPSDLAQPSAVDNLAVLPSGQIPPNPAELLGSRRASGAFDELARDYDFVVIDSPPVLPVTDACVLTQWSDGTIVVVRAGRTGRHELSSALVQLSKANAVILGSVLNGIARGAGSYHYGYYGSAATNGSARGSVAAASVSVGSSTRSGGK
ncbi:polysaccharide biosynthesis tyrosine autokinase [Gordonia westfalica]|uniref:non-specific protein-tyrosine kinase n=1 Tax=Gordonia westfalica TaxID=158898 RepID=A0ABU2GX06_9ACTN|nr:polysaccharide biosynthesis tyrosine autokinase [Gordonia westfalica]MDS1116002.1 polysaccharide biosynthesis tyrosine autokinase [Gordonia westfalica]